MKNTSSDFNINFFPMHLFRYHLSFLIMMTYSHSRVEAAINKPNVLFISIDDLRPELGCYGAEHIKTPHMDKLAGEGTVFLKAYCNAAVCGASRASLLTGMRPIPKKRFKTWNSRADSEAPGVTTLPELFKQNGYYTLSNGKVFHVQDDSPKAWSEPSWRSSGNKGAGIHYYNTYNEWMNPDSKALAKGKLGPFYESADVPDNAYPDGKVCDKTIKDLKRLATTKQPFFLACGFWRPHLPFNAPKKYWDLYDRKTIPLADNRFSPKNAPNALRNSTELKTQYSVTKGWPEDDDFHRLARHGYYASVSYVDAQVGKLMEALDDLGLKENTIVVIWGDHGFLLGEHNFWGKHNTLDRAIHSPLIIRSPGKTPQRLSQLVEFVDLYPTLCDLATLPIPKHIEGKSMEPILNDHTKGHKEAVFSSFGNAYAVKTKDFLYTEWNGGRERMLFNHKEDPEENFNVIESPKYKERINRYKHLLEKLKKTWKQG